ncbi:hypothetical protein BC938DRAFT_479809 [Jimgerdemannia flammicorona]|uniref:Uncharacterized protein n=1 Tax=Jimgerdemannia flammicorona TaxID=994334 RepID=A0A433QK40_9FUNG|nr:hypothetical protein BC938DRAFT_479809 [Jimgerdemannia flammicorona]
MHTVLLEGIDELSNGRTLLTDGDVHTVQLLDFISTIIPLPLVEDGVESDSGLTGLTITNDQFTLTTANGNHRVDRLETSLHRLADRLTGQNAGGLEHSTTTLFSGDGALAIDRLTEGVNHTTKKF